MDNIEKIINYTKKLKLLYVEDNEEARESTLIVLEEFFGEILVAINGEDGYEKFKENEINKESKCFNLIITDINMPKLNGLDMIEKIRQIDTHIPILVLSAYNESGFFMDSIKLGVEGYLLKPIDMEQFIGVLDKSIEKLKLQDKLNDKIKLLDQYQEVTDNSSIVSKTDKRGIITYVNQEFIDISGYKKNELIGVNHNIVRHPDTLKNLYEDMWETIKNKKEIWKGIIRNQSKNGKSYYVKTTVKPILDVDNNIVEYIALRDDITDIMNPKKQLNDAINNSKEPLLVYMKLEDFKILEEFYDNTTVEQIQDNITQYLENNLPNNCKFEKVYQLGNGEYAMVSEKDTCLNYEESFFKKIKEFQNIIQSGVVNVDDINYNISIGMSISYGVNQVLKDAKLGIKKLERTKHNFIISNGLAQKEHETADRNMKTISMIKKALDDSKIVSYFQPIINNKTQKVEKYESLVRLIDENDKVLSPFFFLDIAKKGKYYSQITNRVLENSFRILNYTDMDISMNLSALDIESKSIRDTIFELLDKNKQYASRIVFELLEDESIKEFKTITEFISDVKKLGVKIAIDDFGAGYSNFERLLDYQPDILKIDACLIKNIQIDNYSRNVVETIVLFAKKQNIKTVAEYVENEEIFNIVKELGVDYTQGYYFGKPSPLNSKNK